MFFLWVMYNIIRGECFRKTVGQQSRYLFIFNYKYFFFFDLDCRCLCGKVLDISKSECMDCLLGEKWLLQNRSVGGGLIVLLL